MAANEGGREPIRLAEYGTVTTPHLSASEAQALRAQFGRYLTVQPGWEPGVYELTAKQYVGTIILEDLRIIIKPKVPLRNLFYMLTYAYDLPEFRREETEYAVGDDLFEFVVEIFVQRVGRLVRGGIFRAYVEQDEDGEYLRGRLNMAEQMRRSATQVHRFWQVTNEFTADVLENRILKYALWHLSHLDYRQQELKKRLRRVLSAFSEITLASVGPFDCDQVRYTRLNKAYRTPINLARLLIRHRSPEGREGETSFAAYLFDMDRVFELFVARFLERTYEADPRLQVHVKEDIWLDEDQKERGQPDIVLRRDGLSHLVLDTKYKTFAKQPNPDDRNQMFMYCQTLHLPRGVLIYAGGDAVDYRRIFAGVRLGADVLSLDGSLEEFRVGCGNFAAHLAQVAMHE